MDQTLITIKIDHVTVLRLENQIIKIDKKFNLNHRTETIQKNKINNKTRNSTPKNQRQISQEQSIEQTQSGLPGNVDTKLQQNHLNCESTDDESETENSFSINMLQNENKYKHQ